MTRSEVISQLMELSKERLRIVEVEKLLAKDAVDKHLTKDERKLCLSQVASWHEKYEPLLNAIENLENGMQKAIVFRHYVLGATIEQVSREIHYSTRQVCRINQKGVDNLCKMLKMS